jgi:putative hydrolase of the HAD superfamily
MNSGSSETPVDWQSIDTVLLDMDGTLLDRHFDDYFWEQYVPEHYSLLHDLSIEGARTDLLDQYKAREGTLAWTDLDYWSDALGLDIPTLKKQLDHLIAVHPHVIDFLEFCRENDKQLCLVTNAHSKTLDIKMEKTGLAGYFDHIVCAEQVGLAKEDPAFWQRLEAILGYKKGRTLLADDTEKVLLAAHSYGMGVLIHVSRPSSRKPPAPPAGAERFLSIEHFRELIPGTWQKILNP